MRVLRLQNKKYTCYMPFTKDLKAQKYMADMTRKAMPELKRAVLCERVVSSNAVSLKLIEYGKLVLRVERVFE